MPLAKIIPHGEDRAVVLPRDFKVEGDEVQIEQRDGELVIKEGLPPRPKFKTLNEAARYFAEKFPNAPDFPEVERPKEHERPILEW